jgi:hypothetical protein
MTLRALALAPPLAIALALAAPSTARADGWWETACNSDGLEGDGGCTNPNNSTGCHCEVGSSSAKSASKRAASVGTALAMFAFVGYRVGRKRRRK